jgi:uncharacterized protein
MMKNIVLTFLLILLGQSSLLAQKGNEEFKFPNSVGFVNDFDTIFSEDQKKTLSTMIVNFEKKTTNEIVVVTVSNLGPYKSIGEYTQDLFNTWGVGKAEKDNGLIILLCMPQRSIRITTGRGTEKILTDLICQQILDEVVLPELKKGNNYKAVEKGLKKIMKKWK